MEKEKRKLSDIIRLSKVKTKTTNTRLCKWSGKTFEERKTLKNQKTSAKAMNLV